MKENSSLKKFLRKHPNKSTRDSRKRSSSHTYHLVCNINVVASRALSWSSFHLILSLSPSPLPASIKILINSTAPCRCRPPTPKATPWTQTPINFPIQTPLWPLPRPPSSSPQTYPYSQHTRGTLTSLLCLATSSSNGLPTTNHTTTRSPPYLRQSVRATLGKKFDRLSLI